MPEDAVVRSRSAHWRTYAGALVITAAIFGTAFVLSSYFNDRRIADIRSTQDTISTDILSLETQFDLLQEHSCSDVAENTILPSALSSLGARLSYMEASGGSQDEVSRLKKLYSLLLIKDYLLMKQLSQKCNLKPVFVIYFYSNAGDCPNCEKQGYTLTALSEKYPQLRVYAFDYDLDVGALQTFISLNNTRDELPALYIGNKNYYGYKSIEDIEKILPQLATLQKSASSSKATSTRQ